VHALDNHFRVTDIIKNSKPAKTRLIHLGFDGGLPLAVWADGWFAAPARIREEDGKAEILGDSRLCRAEWLYVNPTCLPRLLTDDEVETGFFRTDRDGPIDTWATLKDSQKIHVTLDMLWIHADSRELVEERSSGSEHEIDKRRENTLLRIIAALVLELTKASGQSQTKIIDNVVDQYPHIPGLKRSTLESNFAKAKRAFENW
jgi:hypothetical protein